MPKSNDFDQMARIVEAVNDSIRADNGLPNERVFKLRHDPTQFRGSREKTGSRNKKQTEFKRTSGASKEM